MNDWQYVRSLLNPYSVLKHTDHDAFLFISFEEPAPFTSNSKHLKEEWIYSDDDSLFEFFKEIILRQTLFNDYVNGDAVPELQNLNFAELFSLLLNAAKKGELDGWHDGVTTLLELEKSINNVDTIDRYKEIEKTLRKHDLNLHVEYYKNKDEALKCDEKNKKELLISLLKSCNSH